MPLLTIFEFNDYKKFVIETIAAQPKKGHGQFRKIAQHLRVHSSLVSQIFKGSRELTLEQAAALVEWLGLTEREGAFFLALVELSRAGTPVLRKMLENRVSLMRRESEELKRRLRQDRELGTNEQAVFYSRWSYIAVWLAGSLSGFHGQDRLSSALGLTREHTAEVMQFLLAHGLLVPKGDRYELGSQRIHLPSDSPLITQHHKNWRLRVLQRLEKSTSLGPEELLFTAPLTISLNDAAKVRKLLLSLIDEVSRVVDKTEPDSFACLNLDWALLARTDR